MNEPESPTEADVAAASVPPGARSERTVEVAVPAAPRFAPVARIAVSGLAIRLGFDVGDVEQLRLAVAAAANALVEQPAAERSSAELEVTAAWDDERFVAELRLTPTAVSGDTIERLEGELRPLLSGRLAADLQAAGVRFTLDPGHTEVGTAETSTSHAAAAERGDGQPELPNP